MKFIILLVIFLTCIFAIPFQANAQFFEGYIIPNDNDTIRGEINILGGKKGVNNMIAFRNKHGGEFRIEAKDLKGFLCGAIHYTRMKSEEEYEFVRVYAKGNINLYERKIKTLHSGRSPSFGGFSSIPTQYSHTKETWLIQFERGTHFIEIPRFEFKETVRGLFIHLPKYLEIFNNGKYKFSEFDSFIKRCNEEHRKQSSTTE